MEILAKFRRNAQNEVNKRTVSERRREITNKQIDETFTQKGEMAQNAKNVLKIKIFKCQTKTWSVSFYTRYFLTLDQFDQKRIESVEKEV
ncbi:hypothetical protein ACH3XW_12935 [Acanthocheilonema viteae]